MSIIHHILMFLVFRIIYQSTVPGSPFTFLYPLGNLITDFILVRAITMSLTGRVTWRGTSYSPERQVRRANRGRTADRCIGESAETAQCSARPQCARRARAPTATTRPMPSSTTEAGSGTAPAATNPR